MPNVCIGFGRFRTGFFLRMLVLLTLLGAGGSILSHTPALAQSQDASPTSTDTTQPDSSGNADPTAQTGDAAHDHDASQDASPESAAGGADASGRYSGPQVIKKDPIQNRVPIQPRP